MLQEGATGIDEDEEEEEEYWQLIGSSLIALYFALTFDFILNRRKFITKKFARSQPMCCGLIVPSMIRV
jgi:hypothetical protein